MINNLNESSNGVGCVYLYIYMLLSTPSSYVKEQELLI